MPRNPMVHHPQPGPSLSKRQRQPRQPRQRRPAPAGAGDDFAAALSLFKSKGCVACHVVSGVAEATGTIGPSLDGLASRTELAAGLPVNAENLAKWIKDPASLKPGTVMPNLSLDDADIDTLVAWLLTLR